MVFSLAKHLQRNGQSLEGVCSSLLFTGGQGQTISPQTEQRHFCLQSSRGAGSSRQAIEYDYNKSHEQQVKERVSNMESELAFSQQHSAPCLGPQHVSFWLPPVHDWAQSTSAGARTPLTGN